MKYRLICFDVDGTLISDDNGNYWSNLHTFLEGREGERIQAERVALFREGKLDYGEWVALDLGDFRKKEFTREDFVRVAHHHIIAPGAEETLAELRRMGCKIAVISGSLNVLFETLFPDFVFDDVFLNEILFDEAGKITSWKETVYDEGTKHKALHTICKREGIDISETVFIGDGENDIDILKEAGLGIAFCPKSDKVREAADVVIEKRDMREILKYLR